MNSRSFAQIFVVVLSLAALAGTVGYGQEKPIKKDLKFTLIPKNINNPYMTTMSNGFLEACKELGEAGKEEGPSETGASAQVPYINTAITQRQNAILVSANDPNALVPYLKKAMEQKIKVVSLDSDTAAAGRELFINQASSEEIGRSLVQVLAKEIGSSGDFAILSATPNATNQNTWIKYMQDELKKPEYKDMKLVKIAYGNDEDQKSFTETQGLLQAYPNLKGIISPTSVGIAAAARYISSSPYKGKVVLTGLGTPNQLREFVKDGTIKEFELWSPADLGYLGAYAAAQLCSGNIEGNEGETFAAGKLGQRTVGKEGVVILGPPTVFNADNIDKFNF